MFGVRETLPPNAPPVKTYRCVACSATFNGLASLLVHQASHAGEFSNPPPPPTCSSCGTVFGSKDLLNQHVCAEACRSAAPDVYICDCGEEWQDFNAFVEHTKSHHGESSQNHTKTQQADITPKGLKDESFGKPATSYPVTHSLSSAEVSVTSRSENMHPECSNSNGISEMDLTEDLLTEETVPKQNSSLSQKLEQALDPAKLDLLVANLEKPTNSSQDAEVDEFEVSKNSILSENNTEKVTQKENPDKKPAPNKVVMKLLANAYMNVKKLPEQELESSKVEESSSGVTIAGESDTTSSPKRQLRPSLRRPLYLPFPRIVYNMDAPKKPIVSVTRRYCPVVLLETRQKFVASGKDMQENYQCGQCKRLFSDVDKLVVHHALHRKERLKCCRRCKQFVIGTSGPDNHTCSRTSTSGVKSLLSKGKRSPGFHKKKFLKPNKPNQFHCPLCNHSYTRLYSLKKHNCPWISSMTNSGQDTRGDMEDCQNVDVNGQDLSPLEFVSIGVGTSAQRQFKKEMVNAEIVSVDSHQTNIENSFDVLQVPFEDGDESVSSKEAPSPLSAEGTTSEPKVIFEDDLVPTLQADQVKDVGTKQPVGGVVDDDRICIDEQGEEGEGTSPVEDAEIDVLIEADDDDGDDDLHSKNNILHQILVEGSTVSKAQNQDISSIRSNEPVKRHTCGRCHKSFTRNYGLNKHLKICSVGRQHDVGTSVAHEVFKCKQCGKGFSHMASLTIHRRSCHTGKRMHTELSGSYNPTRQENVFVLPPLSENPSNRQEPTAENNETNWGIMSLPSVLPRRVTCECGSVFTCPRRLFEHLQMHAQESYICPHCGENLLSWMKYETHLRSHVQYQQASEEQPQQYAASYQQQQSYMQRPQQQSPTLLSSHQLSTPLPTQAPSSCPKCCKTFKTRRSLLRHLRLSCYGDTSAPKKFACSRCGMSFLSTYTLDLHMQSNTCTTSVKQMRCPVCVRSFSSVEGLKRHLVIHSHDKPFSCHSCSQIFQNPKDLEDHKKSAHGVLQQEQGLLTEESREEITITSNNRLFKFFRCNMCPRMYHSMKSLKEHRKKVHSLFGGGHGTQTGEGLGSQNSQMNFFRCQLCQRTYHTLKSLKNHRRRVHRILAGSHVPQKTDSSGVAQSSSSAIFRCQICHRAYPTLKAWRNHRRRVHRILGGGPEMQAGESLKVMQSQSPGFTCQTCQRTYPTLQSLREHRRKAHHIPGAVPDSQRGNVMDVMLNSESLVFACQICDRSYSKLQSLKDHRRKVHHIPGGQLDVIKVE